MPEPLTATVSLKDHREWREFGLPEHVVYIGRVCYRGGWRLTGHPLANPYPLRKYGLWGSLAKYSKWLPLDPKRVALAESLRGMTLGCFCQGTPCHAHLVACFADGRLDDIQGVLEQARSNGADARPVMGRR